MAERHGMTRRRAIAGGAVGAAALAVGASRSTGREAVRPNLLFVFSDQQRRHALGCMSEDPVETPNTDRFVREGTLFTSALSASPLCAPFRGVLLTGRYPHSTGVLTNGPGLRPGETTIGTVLRDAGYQTAYIGKWHLYDNGIDDWREWHFNQRGQFVPNDHRFGFDYWHGVNCNHRTFWRLYYGDSEEPDVCEPGWQPEHDVDSAIHYLEDVRRPDGPFALFVSMVPPHNTHGPGFVHHEVPPQQRRNPQLFRTQHHAPDRYERRYHDRDLPRRPNVPEVDYSIYSLPGYLGACTGLDDQFGRLLACLDRQGLADDTIVVYTSDHGDMMGSHGRMGKSVWYEESIGVPFIVRWPGHVPVGRDDMLLNTPDVMPTLLGMMGVDVPETVEGTDRSRILLGGSGDRPESALIQLGNWRALRTADHTLIARADRNNGTDIFMYDLAGDPYQMRPLRAGDGADGLMADMLKDLRDWLERTDDPFAADV